jgi:hypothetical protein
VRIKLDELADGTSFECDTDDGLGLHSLSRAQYADPVADRDYACRLNQMGPGVSTEYTARHIRICVGAIQRDIKRDIRVRCAGGDLASVILQELPASNRCSRYAGD